MICLKAAARSALHAVKHAVNSALQEMLAVAYVGALAFLQRTERNRPRALARVYFGALTVAYVVLDGCIGTFAGIKQLASLLGPLVVVCTTLLLRIDNLLFVLTGVAAACNLLRNIRSRSYLTRMVKKFKALENEQGVSLIDVLQVMHGVVRLAFSRELKDTHAKVINAAYLSLRIALVDPTLHKTCRL